MASRPIQNISDRIKIRVSNKRAFVWNLDDIALIRSRHRLCGILTGTLPHLSQQNLFLGIPLQLMPEEVYLLVSKELAVIIDDAQAHSRPPMSADVENWRISQEADIRQQLSVSSASQAAKMEAFLSQATSAAAIQKQKEREARRAAKAAALANDTGDASLLIPISDDFPPKEATSDTPFTSSSQFCVTIPASSTYRSWYDPTAHVYSTIDDTKAAGIWDFPTTLSERARCGVFVDLWMKGYFMGGGIKFGGEYLVYPGDPLRYHSHFTATIVESPSADMRPMEIVAHGRLGTATKKTHLLCGYDDSTKEVSYLSIEWAGFG
ncbi:tRNA-intron endonuclease catalytic domain-like protein [Fistulina hepatica ATCC 64428]|nr:tRNA-intron endonuclease catalytic domain-like protein [Fistulina hepatica ATCC 64428]